MNSISGHDGRLDSMNPATGTAISGERSRWTEVAAVGPDRWTVASLAAAAASRPVALFLALAVYAFAFQGTRSLWEPDEGRYTAVALEMSRLGDYVIPRLNHESVHLTKPPLTYWLMSISMQVFGQHEWAARLPNALAFIATVLVVAAIGRRITPRAALPAPLVYALSLLPVAAANVISTDTLLTLWETLAVYGFVEMQWGPAERRRRSQFVLWLALGFAFLTKGPPGLIPLLPIVIYTATTAGWREVRRLASWTSFAAFAIVGLSWYLAIVATTPGALVYLLRREVFDRMFSSTLDRNAGWLGPFRAYLPVIVLGGLPWVTEMTAGVRGARAWFRPQWWRDRLASDRIGWFLSLWLVVPLVIFVVARSRMPLYLLPLAVPASLLIARLAPSAAATSRRRAVVLAAWVAFIVLGRGALALKSSSKDSRALARAIEAGTPTAIDEVVYVETIPRYGVALYLDAEVERVAIYPQAADPLERTYEPLEQELAEDEGSRVFVVSSEDVDSFLIEMSRLGREVEQRGGWRKLSFYRMTK